jgi:hypothetical protein
MSARTLVRCPLWTARINTFLARVAPTYRTRRLSVLPVLPQVEAGLIVVIDR